MMEHIERGNENYAKVFKSFGELTSSDFDEKWNTLKAKINIRLLSKVVKDFFLRRGRFKTCPLVSIRRDLLTQGGF